MFLLCETSPYPFGHHICLELCIDGCKISLRFPFRGYQERVAGVFCRITVCHLHMIRHPCKPHDIAQRLICKEIKFIGLFRYHLLRKEKAQT